MIGYNAVLDTSQKFSRGVSMRFSEWFTSIVTWILLSETSEVQLGTGIWAHVRICHKNWHCVVCSTSLRFDGSFLQLQHNFTAVTHSTSHCSLIHRLNSIEHDKLNAYYVVQAYFSYFIHCMMLPFYAVFSALGLELDVEKEGLGIRVTYGTVFAKRYLQIVPWL